MEEKHDAQPESVGVPPMLDKAWKYFLYGFFVLAAPIFNFTLMDTLKPEWQDGKLSSHILLALLPEAALWFFPLLAYAAAGYIALLWDSDRFAGSWIVRLGVYSGTFLALQYSVLTVAALNAGSFWIVMAGFLAPLILGGIHRRAAAKWEAALVRRLFIGFGVVAFAASVLLTGDLFASFLLIALFLGVSAPFWCFLIALHASRWLWTHSETKPTLPRGLGVFAWFSAYLFALRFDILKMFELYNALPTQPPNCYIATAAAQGHPRLVGSREVILANGKTMRVNRQMRRLKAWEIAWAGASAPGHRMMRRVYDVLGKRLAKRIQNPILADIAYLLLIPVEYASFFALQWLVPEIQIMSERLYRS